MVFAITEEDYQKLSNGSADVGLYLDSAYIGRKVDDVLRTIEHDVLDMFRSSGEIVDSEYWYVFNGNMRYKVLVECVPSVSVEWSIEEEWLA